MSDVLELLTRRADLAPATADRDARTVEVIWSTGAPVRRRDMAGEYIERLSLDAAAVDLSRLEGRLPCSMPTGSRPCGTCSASGGARAAVDGRRRTALIQFSGRPEVEPIWQDVLAGILRHVSVGYARRGMGREPTRNGARGADRRGAGRPTRFPPGADTCRPRRQRFAWRLDMTDNRHRGGRDPARDGGRRPRGRPSIPRSDPSPASPDSTRAGWMGRSMPRRTPTPRARARFRGAGKSQRGAPRSRTGAKCASRMGESQDEAGAPAPGSPMGEAPFYAPDQSAPRALRAPHGGMPLCHTGWTWRRNC